MFKVKAATYENWTGFLVLLFILSVVGGVFAGLWLIELWPFLVLLSLNVLAANLIFQVFVSPRGKRRKTGGS